MSHVASELSENQSPDNVKSVYFERIRKPPSAENPAKNAHSRRDYITSVIAFPVLSMVVTVSDFSFIALPRENPRIESLTTSYAEGDTVEAKCVSDPADPTPILSWYINGLEVTSLLQRAFIFLH